MTINFDSKKNYKVIGTNPIRHDGYDKVTNHDGGLRCAGATVAPRFTPTS